MAHSKSKSVASTNLNCTICLGYENDKVMYGEWLEEKDEFVHYFCLLSGNHIYQTGDLKSCLKGFTLKDIKKSRGKYINTPCYVCNENSAAVNCAVNGCERAWHFPCGIRKACMTVFSGQFQSYCDEHVPDPNSGKRHVGDVSCPICFCYLDSPYKPEVPYNHVDSILSSCCAKFDDYRERFMHRDCVMNYTFNAGYDSMCPTCPMDDEPGTLEEKKERWQTEMRLKGIYIPMAEASWEQEGYFKNQVKNKCGKRKCPTPSSLDTVWTCFVCGCDPLHLACAQVSKPEDYNCVKCINQSFVQRVPRF